MYKHAIGFFKNIFYYFTIISEQDVNDMSDVEEGLDNRYIIESDGQCIDFYDDF
jgi:hypothetical protein